MSQTNITVKEIKTYEALNLVINHFKDTYFLRAITDDRYKDIYIKKQLEDGHFIVEFHNDIPVGFISFYSNDSETHIAYITALALSDDLGFLKGKTLFRIITEAFKIAKATNMEIVQLEVEKDNKRAIKLYEHFGFKYIGDGNNNSFYMQMNIKDFKLLK
ncbi:Ribosomal protein S18 acetylase RimI [Pseudobutyrivibrio sp. YE44]|uniref:GNAT family N-acetyltransferase n=1 Tax=Pseudobutyrivibrio sp. YE44 TaxID=1520802 RepID=UPI0008906250|nr:GNAT family N-acetyltransferase [Pseudobutyrivibrio sp. YE44]SDB05586.1 Ribosomal protein S18 acetylase RimI [Pseudobutyrivibrio sp. YE44]